MRMTRPDVVSVVIVNYRGTDDTLAALDGLAGLDWPADRLDVIVVDNASGDDGVARIREAHPGVQLVELPENVGFAGGCNRGVDVATGQYVALLNNDARPDPGWLREACRVIHDDGVACVASKVLDWDRQVVDFVDAAVAFYGHGFKLHAGEPDSAAYDDERDVLFASGAAMVIDAEVYREVGGFDESYFMFFEDVDLGWRLWLLGYRVRYVPASLVYHRHHATMSRFRPWRHDYLLERNALFTVFKNYDEQNMRTALPAALMVAVRRGITKGDDDPTVLDLARGADGEDVDRIEVHKQTIAPCYAIDALVEQMPQLLAKRRRIQAQRRRADHELSRLFKLPLFANIGDERFVHGFDAVVEAFGVAGLFSPKRKVLVATGDTLEPKMAGPAIRAWQIASALAQEHDVQLVTTLDCNLSHPAFAVRHVDDPQLSDAVAWSDIVVFQGNLMAQHRALRKTDKIVVADIYDPFHLEVLEQARTLSAIDRRFATKSSKEVLNEQLMRGDFFLCASDKQRDFWLGQLAGVGRVNPSTYDESESLERLIAVVPFGVSNDAPRHTRSVLKGVLPGIDADDKVILWGGGIYNWFDPLTLLRAVDKLRARLPDVRLFFLGLKHPNPYVGEMRMAVDARALADELDLTGSHVFFNEDWVAYEDRQNYLLEADIGVSTHLDHVETAFSFRTRILDYFWAGLPVVATAGDSLAETIESEGAGLAVPAGDVDALEDALFRILDDEPFAASCRAASTRVAADFRWSKVLEPLLEFCRAPRRAPDLVDPIMAANVADPLKLRHARRRFQRDLGIVVQHVRDGDFKSLARRAAGRARRLLRAR